MPNLGLYVHIPFCHKICRYCDFVKRTSSFEIKKNYVASLLKEIAYYQEIFRNNSFKSIYLGGGTPSSLELDLLEEILLAITKALNMSDVNEFTIEANPEDLTIEFINLLKRYQINRISIGVQSFNSDVLRVIGRSNNYEDLKNKINLLKTNGLTNINLDFMFGFKNVSLADTLKDLEKIISLEPTHISSYSLILEEKTVLYHEYLKGNFDLMSEDEEQKTYFEIIKKLEEAGYEQYEISNFAKVGYQSIHNFIYWSNERYLGIGLGSSSYLNNVRFKNVSALNEYQAFFEGKNKSLYEEEDILTLEEEMEYEIVMRLRLRKGINRSLFLEKFQKDLFAIYPIAQLIKDNYLVYDQVNQNVYINFPYIYLTDYIIKKII